VTAHPKLITTAGEIAELAHQLRKAPVIAFDTEFIRENTFFPVVEILQVATEQDSWLVDVQAFRQGRSHRLDDLKPLLDVFTDPSILKILHAAQGDQECLYTAFGIVASPSMDTAIAASLLGYGDNIGLGNLTKSVLGISLKKGHGRTNWSARPLPNQLLEYAHGDVEHLVKLGKILIEGLEKRGRKDWAFQLSKEWEDKKRYESDPEAMALRLAKGGRLDQRGFAVLLELMKWRETRVRQLNLPRRWVADDSVLTDLAQVRPKDLEHLGAFRGLNKGEIQKSGPALLDAIRRGEANKDAHLPKSKRPDIPTESEEQVLDLLKCYIGILSDRHEISSRNLVTTAQLLPLLRSGANDPQDLEKPELLSGAAAKLVGSEIISFLQGKRALSVQRESGHFSVRIVEIESGKTS
jgi:ribonuclease D